MADEQTTKQILNLFFFPPNQYIVYFYPFLKGIKRTIQIPTTKKSEADKETKISH